MYTGFFKDMSTGVIFGLKLPTGTFTRPPGIDRDSQIGTGSTDLLLGAFHRGLLTGDNAWQYFGQVMWRRPFLYQSAGLIRRAAFDGNPIRRRHANSLIRESKSMALSASTTITCTTCSGRQR